MLPPVPQLKLEHLLQEHHLLHQNYSQEPVLPWPLEQEHLLLELLVLIHLRVRKFMRTRLNYDRDQPQPPVAAPEAVVEQPAAAPKKKRVRRGPSNLSDL